ncbi:MAG: DUF3096 domain-containing protein [Actinomycetota bacterium]
MLDISFMVAQGARVSVDLRLPGILALVAGVLILLFPKLLNYVVAGYLIFVGAVQVFDVHF